MIDTFTVPADQQHVATPAQSEQQSSDINVDESERWVSAVGGSALAVYGLKHRSLLWTVIGGVLAYRGLSGHCHMYAALGVSTASNGQRRFEQQAIEIKTALTINREPADLYQYWRNFENLPYFMKHIDAVKVRDDTYSYWRIKMPADTTLEWEAQITDDRPNELIAWESLYNADIDNRGSVRFLPAPGGRGTRVYVDISYRPPAGPVGQMFAKLLNRVTAQQVKEDLRRFKSLMETREIPTITGQPSGQAQPPFDEHLSAQKRFSAGRIDIVQEASEESFPASDAPAWHVTT